MWLVAPADKTYFHPIFLNVLETGRESGSIKKSQKLRQQELLEYCGSHFLQLVAKEPALWLSNASIAMVTLAILKSGKFQKSYLKIELYYYSQTSLLVEYFKWQ